MDGKKWFLIMMMLLSYLFDGHAFLRAGYILLNSNSLIVVSLVVAIVCFAIFSQGSLFDKLMFV